MTISPCRIVSLALSNCGSGKYQPSLTTAFTALMRRVRHQSCFFLGSLLTIALASQAYAATWYVSTTGNDTNSCASASAPCATLNGAYQKAKGGDTVTIAAGTYGAQTIAAYSPSSDVILQPASGASVTLGSTDVSGSHFNLQNVTISGNYTLEMNAFYDTLQNVTLNGGIFIVGGSNFSMIGGSVGPGVNFHPQIAPVNGWNGQGENLTFDGVYFHDWTSTNLTLYHMECLQVVGTTNLVIRNSKFHHCDVFDLSFTTYNNSGQVTTPTLENNWFDTATNGGYFAINFQAMQGGLVHFNSSSQAWVMQSSAGGAVGTITGPVTFDGNIVDGGILDGDVYGCNPSNYASYNYNVTNGWKCASTDANAAPGFVNESGFDFDLASGATAIDFVPLSIPYPAADIDGNKRPDGNANDAGASQVAQVAAPTGLSAVVQ